MSNCRNILVTKPAYIAEMFKHEETYAKSGNQVKIPHSVLAEYTGENIISAHGEKWRLYQRVIKPALQADQDSEQIWKNSRMLRNMFLGESKTAGGNGIPIYSLLHRYALANLSEVLYSSSFETLQHVDAPLHMIQMKIKPIIFQPIFMNFPFLDYLPLEVRKLGRVLSKQFRGTLRTAISKGHSQHVCNENDSRNVACRLLGSHREGILSDKDLDDNLVSTFLAGHENPQLALMSLMYLLGTHTSVQEAVRKEISTLFPADAHVDYEPSYTNLYACFLRSHSLSIAVQQHLSYLATRYLYPPVSTWVTTHTPRIAILSSGAMMPMTSSRSAGVPRTRRSATYTVAPTPKALSSASMVEEEPVWGRNLRCSS